MPGKNDLTDPAMLKFRTEGSRMPAQTDKQLAHMTANYYGMISQIDHNVGRILKVADGVVVGTSLKLDGHIWNPVDPDRARRLVDAMAGFGSSR